MSSAQSSFIHIRMNQSWLNLPGKMSKYNLHKDPPDRKNEPEVVLKKNIALDDLDLDYVSIPSVSLKEDSDSGLDDGGGCLEIPVHRATRSLRNFKSRCKDYKLVEKEKKCLTIACLKSLRAKDLFPSIERLGPPQKHRRFSFKKLGRNTKSLSDLVLRTEAKERENPINETLGKGPSYSLPFPEFIDLPVPFETVHSQVLL